MHRYFFLHLLKTGGTALYQRLKEQFPDQEMYPNASDGDPKIDATHYSLDRLLDRWSVRGSDIRVLTGHFPLCTTELLDGTFTVFTLLRDPVERTLSYLRHHRAIEAGDQDLSLEEIYANPLRFTWFIHNHMVKMLSTRTDEVREGMMSHVELTRHHLDQAIENLTAIDLVGLQESFDDFCEELESRYGWDLGEPRFANRTRRAEASASFKKRIAADNALDVELYQHATELVESRRSRTSSA